MRAIGRALTQLSLRVCVRVCASVCLSVYLARARVGGWVGVGESIENYDHWAAHGCTGWSYKEVLPYFKKSEDCDMPGVDRYAQPGP
jgi:hypothetical protein